MLTRNDVIIVTHQTHCPVTCSEQETYTAIKTWQTSYNITVHRDHTVLQCTEITVLQCTEITVLQCTEITALQCTEITVLQCTEIIQYYMYKVCVYCTYLTAANRALCTRESRQERRLNSFRTRCPRRILDVSWRDKLHNTVLPERAGVTSMYSNQKS